MTSPLDGKNDYTVMYTDYHGVDYMVSVSGAPLAMPDGVEIMDYLWRMVGALYLSLGYNLDPREVLSETVPGIDFVDPDDEPATPLDGDEARWSASEVGEVAAEVLEMHRGVVSLQSGAQGGDAVEGCSCGHTGPSQAAHQTDALRRTLGAAS